MCVVCVYTYYVFVCIVHDVCMHVYMQACCMHAQIPARSRIFADRSLIDMPSTIGTRLDLLYMTLISVHREFGKGLLK